MRRFLLVVSLLCLAVPAGRASAQRCELPQVLLSVDKSSSMLGGLPSGGTKWDAARMAIGELTSTYAANIAFGLQVFPYPDRCEPGAVTMGFGTHDPVDILSALGDPPPSGGNYTPMAQTLDAASDYYASRLAPANNHLILVTDGWQWCDPYDSSTRFTPVDAVARLRALGVTVHVVGFGASVDSLTLNRAAVAAGTGLPGCDASLADPAAMNHCYLQANDLLGLRAALDSIARLITDEMCDGLDNDCDGVVDEGYDVDSDGYTTCGSDPSMPGVDPDPTLADCDDAEATVYPGAPELCDGLDNDCDGTIDPGCDCTNGDSQPCGAWGSCEGGLMGGAETCDMTDEDCDGTVDEDADASCGPGEACTADGCIPLTPPDMDPVPPMTDRSASTAPGPDVGTPRSRRRHTQVPTSVHPGPDVGTPRSRVAARGVVARERTESIFSMNMPCCDRPGCRTRYELQLMGAVGRELDADADRVTRRPCRKRRACPVLLAGAVFCGPEDRAGGDRGARADGASRPPDDARSVAALVAPADEPGVAEPDAGLVE